MDLKITLKNYRCFSDTAPVSVSIGKGFTALVGPNNSGKSSLLKLVYELRELWNSLGNMGDFVPLFHGNAKGANALGVYDQDEIFCDSNNRDIVIELDLTEEVKGTPQNLVINHAGIIRERITKNWRANFRTSPSMSSKSTAFVHEQGDILRQKNDQSHIDCAHLMTCFRQLKNSFYIGPFRNAINQGASAYFDISIGSDFINTWNAWKTGQNKAQNIAIEQITEDIRKIFRFKKLEIAVAQDLKTLQVNIDGKPYKLGELGAGLSQFILVFGNAAIKKPDYILLDEPELNLHPSLQIDFLTSLTAYAKEGVVFATHSIGLARAIGDRIYSLQKRGDEVNCRLFEQTPNYAEFIGEMSFASYKELGFEKILLVEGVTDVKTIQQFLRLLDKDHRVIVIPLGGDQLAKGNVELELGELKRITSPANIVALVDSEKESDAGMALAARISFQESCKRLGFRAHLTERRAIENYFSDQAVKEAMGAKCNALGHYQRLKDSANAWDKKDNWRIARHMKWEELEHTDIGKFLAGI